MSQVFVTPTSTSRRPGLIQSRRAPLKTPILTQLGQRSRVSPAVSGALPTLSPRPRPMQTPLRKPNTSQIAAPSPPCRAQARITEMIFCSSIQGRPEWAPVVPLLQAAHAEPGWAKARLSSHDLAIRIASLEANSAPGAANTRDPVAGSPDNMIRFLLVAPADVDKPDMTNKLQRLARRKNGLGGVILFLLANDDGDGHNMAAYSQIQIDLRDTDLSILPLMAVATLPATVAAFCSQFTMPLRADYCTSPDNTLHDLLRMYFGDPVPLSLDGAKRLVAATEEAAHHRPSGNATLQDVVRFCSGLETRGPHRLADLLGVEDAARLADF